MRSFLSVLFEHLSNLSQIHFLAAKEMKKTYKGSMLGVGWAFIRPTLYIFIFWFAIHFGIRSAASDTDVPFIAWLAAGISPWFFISDTLTFGGNSIRNQSYLVTKMKFPISIIPTFRILSQWYIHVSFLIVIVCFVASAGVNPFENWYMYPYIILCSLAFMTVLTLITSTFVVISRDFEQFLKAFASILFWLVPAIWKMDGLPKIAQFVISLNPMVYLIELYRGEILGTAWFTTHYAYTLYFWVCVTGLGLAGAFIHMKLRSQFADIL
jgi:ABC-type polysaccharide/polyol phosphate export permease